MPDEGEGQGLPAHDVKDKAPSRRLAKSRLTESAAFCARGGRGARPAARRVPSGSKPLGRRAMEKRMPVRVRIPACDGVCSVSFQLDEPAASKPTFRCFRTSREKLFSS